MAGATITGYRPDVAEDLNRSANSAIFSNSIDRNLLRKPDGYVYIFSISKRSFVVERPPHIPHLMIKECGRAERYIQVARIADPFQQPGVNEINGRTISYPEDARRIAMDICNPNNISLNQDLPIKPEWTFGYGQDLTRQGVFWSMNETPTEDELAAAEKRRETYFNMLVEDSKGMTTAELREKDKLTPDLRMALDYFGLQTEYHQKLSMKVECPNCGESVKQGLAYHKHADGMYCVIDWKRAVEAGVKTKADVPDSKRWWSEQPPASRKNS